MVYKIQFRDKGKKRFYNLSYRKFRTLKEARKMKSMAEKDFPSRVFKIKIKSKVRRRNPMGGLSSFNWNNPFR